MKISTLLLGGVATLFSASIALAADAADVAALPGISGDFSIWGGLSSQHIVESNIQDFTGNLFGMMARGNWWVNNDLNIQLDGSGEFWQTTEDGGFNTSVMDAAAHFDWRHGNDGLFGGFLSVGMNNDFDAPASFGTIALEAQQTWSNFTLYGQAGYTTSIAGGGSDLPLNAKYLHAAARFAVTPNIGLGADAGYAWIDMDDHARNVLRWGAKIDAAIPNTPLDIFLNYQGHYTDVTESGDKVTVHALLVGLTLNFNSDAAKSMRQDDNPFTGVNYPRDAY